jgi:hypothetical protein
MATKQRFFHIDLQRGSQIAVETAICDKLRPASLQRRPYFEATPNKFQLPTSNLGDLRSPFAVQTASICPNICVSYAYRPL